MIKNKILESIQRLNLDLKGKVVLTEAATGAYAVTPVLAALAGAEVYAFTKNTKYGSVEEVRHLVNELASRFDRKLSINVIDDLTPEIISKADIITNSGHLRPLDESKLRHAKKGVAIPLMYEAWEFRDADLDLEFCKTKNIPIAATNERHPDIDVFNYLGDMALKMIFDAGLCPYNNNFILMCNNDFGPFIAKVLSAVCTNLGVCDMLENKGKYNGIKIDWLGNFPDLKTTDKYKNSAAVIFTAYPFNKTWIGENDEPITIENLLLELDNPFILRYAGHIDEAAFENKITYYPKSVTPGHMGILPSAIGNDPIIRLQSGGLKVAEMMLKKVDLYNENILLEYL
jgi:hypothetical protein